MESDSMGPKVTKDAAAETMDGAAPRKRGRPPKHPEQTKGPKGRPSTPLRADPDRYAMAYLVARQMLTPTAKPNTLARDIAQMNACSIASPGEAEEFTAALAEGRKVRVRKGRGPATVDDPTDAKWRNKDWANAQGEKLWRKTDRFLRNMPDPSDTDSASGDQRDAHWLRLMVDTWLVVFDVCQGTLAALSLDDARTLAAQAGEADYFDAVMMQYVRTAFRVAPRFFAI
jgi:hypothetical protein